MMIRSAVAFAHIGRSIIRQKQKELHKTLCVSQFKLIKRWSSNEGSKAPELKGSTLAADVEAFNEEFDEIVFEDNDENGITADIDTTTAGTLPGHRIRGILCPTLETHAAIIDGQRYDQLPIAHVKATYQNTHVKITDGTGRKAIAYSTGGTVGFKNAKKKTNIAAQSAGFTAGEEAIAQGLTHIRVQINGIGKGRLSACKGLEQSGLNIVSLTDNSILDWGTRIPRKKRRL